MEKIVLGTFGLKMMDGYYAPTLLYKFKKDLYYKMFMPKNVCIRTADVYKQSVWYQDIVNTTIDDLRPGGKDRYHLCVSIPLIQYCAKMSDNQEFKEALNEHLKLIEYDRRQVVDELNASIRSLAKKRT